MKGRRVYNQEFKLDAVELANSSDKPITEIASDLGISYHLLCKWRYKYSKEGKEGFSGQGNLKENKEFKTFRKKTEIVKGRKRHIKKSFGHLFKTPREKYKFMINHKEHSVEQMCRVLWVSISGYYGFLNNPVSRRDLENAELTLLIKKEYETSRGVYGSL